MRRQSLGPRSCQPGCLFRLFCVEVSIKKSARPNTMRRRGKWAKQRLEGATVLCLMKSNLEINSHRA